MQGWRWTLEMGLWDRARSGRDTTCLTRHPEERVQYVAVRYSQRLADVGAVALVGSAGDSCDNPFAKAFNSLFEAALIRNLGRTSKRSRPPGSR